MGGVPSVPSPVPTHTARNMLPSAGCGRKDSALEPLAMPAGSGIIIMRWMEL